jgi:GT2 family glycosyltransferase
VTIVVPTRDRPEQLRLCLEALAGSPVDGFEIVVVDDGSSSRSETAAVAASVGAVLVRLGGSGPAAARNAGARAATGEVVLFVDDDCVPSPGWATELAALVSREARLVVAGRVGIPADAGVWLRASEGLAEAAETGLLLRTNNLGCRRSLLLEVPFDERFRSAAGEDRDWCVRVAGAGATLVRDPAATVEHRARLGARGFFAQQLRYGRAVRQLQRYGTHAPAPRGAVLRAVASGARDGLDVAAAMVVAQAAGALGYVLEALSNHPARV